MWPKKWSNIFFKNPLKVCFRPPLGVWRDNLEKVLKSCTIWNISRSCLFAPNKRNTLGCLHRPKLFWFFRRPSPKKLSKFPIKRRRFCLYPEYNKTQGSCSDLPKSGTYGRPQTSITTPSKKCNVFFINYLSNKIIMKKNQISIFGTIIIKKIQKSNWFYVM